MGGVVKLLNDFRIAHLNSAINHLSQVRDSYDSNVIEHENLQGEITHYEEWIEKLENSD